MKLSKDNSEIQRLLSSGKIAAGGFLGNDYRTFIEIIEADSAELARLNLDSLRIAQEMMNITEKAQGGLGNWVKINEKLMAKVDEAKGFLICPWPHKSEKFRKRVTTLRDVKSGDEIKWSDLSIHLISEHCFFQGKGAVFRIEPAKIAKMLFS